MNEVKQKGSNRDKIIKRAEVAVACVLAISVLLLAGLSLSNKKTGHANMESNYTIQTELRLASVLSEIDGAGKVSVFLNFESEGEKVIATESIRSEQGVVTTKPVLSGGKPIVLEEKMPKITGVLIVAEGAEDLNVRFNLLEAAASVLNINQGIIKVYAKETK